MLSYGNIYICFPGSHLLFVFSPMKPGVVWLCVTALISPPEAPFSRRMCDSAASAHREKLKGRCLAPSLERFNLAELHMMKCLIRLNLLTH